MLNKNGLPKITDLAVLPLLVFSYVNIKSFISLILFQAVTLSINLCLSSKLDQF